ncbi:hypothetical protein [Vibrio rotiferianus]|uniref:hypothetical protein n=1 Tax=Vibrio rotiferianus TaxID=190895 RepID=UPI002893E24F|nr:conserved hypothetical protein [Vibrio rotiferianus]
MKIFRGILIDLIILVGVLSGVITFSLNKVDILGTILIVTASLLILALFIYGLKDGYKRSG